MADIEITGTDQEVRTFRDVHSHYTLAKEDLEQRIFRKNGFDDADKMFASFLDESSWPYKSLIFDPRPYTIILEKSARLIGSKPKGRLIPREGGDTLGAYINNELLSFQYDDNSRLGEAMLSKWINMDQNARKYGAAFGITKWRYQTKVKKEKDEKKKAVFFDGPDFVVCNARDVLANPSYGFVNKWFQYREYMTLDELEMVNDASRANPTYKNLDKLRDALAKETRARGDSRETTTQLKNKTMRGLSDYLGRDEVFKTVEIITEYRADRWITFAPRQGVVIRDIPNPYDHGEIPVVQLKYYPLPDDLYGVSELEPTSKLIRGINALFSQYIDNITVDLYPPLMVNPVNVRMHTLDFSPEAKWLMNTPGVDVKRMETSTAATNNFSAAYSIMVGSLNNAWGESSQGYSQINPTQDQGKVTATEIKDTAFTRNARDNMNSIFLAEAIKKQYMFWHSMNKQLMFKGTADKQKIIRIVGRDAVEFFNRKGLSDIRPTQQDAEMIAMGQLDPNDVPPGPMYPVELEEGMETTKFMPDENGEGGNLIIEEGDLLGSYDYVVDIESMKSPTNEDVEAKLTAVLGTITNPAILQLLAQENTKPKIKELLIKLYEATKVVKDAEGYFEDIPQQPMGTEVMPNGQPSQAQPGGAGGPEAGIPGQGNGIDAGVGGGPAPVAGGQNQPFVG
jgi:hypothetical protein